MKCVRILKVTAILLLAVLILIAVVNTVMTANTRLVARHIVSNILNVGLNNIDKLADESIYSFEENELRRYIADLISSTKEVIANMERHVANLSNEKYKHLLEYRINYVNNLLDKASEELGKGDLINALGNAKYAAILAEHNRVYLLLVLNKTSASEVKSALIRKIRELSKLHSAIGEEYLNYIRRGYLGLSSIAICYKIELKLMSVNSILRRTESLINRRIYTGSLVGQEELDLIAGMAGNLELVKCNLRETKILLSGLRKFPCNEELDIGKLYARLHSTLLSEIKALDSITRKGTLARNILKRIKSIEGFAEEARQEGFPAYSVVEVLKGITYARVLRKHLEDLNALLLPSDEDWRREVTVKDLESLLTIKRSAADALNQSLRESAQLPYRELFLRLLVTPTEEVKSADQRLRYFEHDPLGKMTRYHYLTLYYDYLGAKYFAQELSSVLRELMSP